MDKNRLKELLKIEAKYDILKEAHDHYRDAAARANHYILQQELNKVRADKYLERVLQFIETKRGRLDEATLGIIRDFVLTLEKERLDNGYCNSESYYKSL